MNKEFTSDVPLKVYIDSRFDEIKESTDRAYESMERRLAGMNEFRDTLRDQAGKFVTRNELNIIIDRISVDIKNLNTAKDIMTGKASQSSVLFSYALGVVGIIVGVFGLLR